MADLRDTLAAALGTAFTLGRELGGGGMSRVFVAHDEALGRDVVVKLLSPELAQSISADRFAREIRLAAGLQEPHIVPVLSAGHTADGLPYYTMPYVRGESLRQRIASGPIAIAEGVAILRNVARALAYAHTQGVVHRDIKPENVLLSEGTAVVTDFGIAKAVAASKTQAPGGALTQLGTSLGTPAYMAPEQAAGDEVDGRADIYAWAVMAYETLSGIHPFAERTTAQQLIAAHIAEVPRPLGTANPQLPPLLVALVTQCLAKTPGERPADARALVSALDDRRLLDDAVAVARLGATAPSPRSKPASRRSAVAAAIAALVALGLFSQRSRVASLAHGVPAAYTAAVADSGAIRLAVLPFENLGRPQDAYIVDGITDEVRSKLASVSGLRVIARASSNAYRASAKTPQQIASELGVQYLLTGTLRSDPGAEGKPGRLKVSPELVRISGSGAPEVVWSQSVDENSGDMFQVQAAIATKVADAMNVALAGSDRARMVEIPTQQPGAYDAFLHGEANWEAGTNGDHAALERAADYYEQAVSLDPTYVAAWAKLARANAQLFAEGGNDQARAARARVAADRVMVLAPDRPESRRALAASIIYLDWDFPKALAAYEPVRSLASGHADLLQGMAAAEAGAGRLEESVRHFWAARALDPRSTAFANELGGNLIALRRYDEAKRELDRAFLIAPGNPLVQQARMGLELSRGDLPAARAVLAESQRINGVRALFFVPAWMLNDEQRKLRLAAAIANGGPEGPTALVNRIELAVVKGDTATARLLAAKLIPILKPQLRYDATNANTVAEHGALLALARRADEGIAESERGAALRPYSRDAGNAWLPQYSLARTYLLAGKPDRSIDVLEELTRHPTPVTPAWLRIDPTWNSLRALARFQRLVAP